MSPAEQSLEQIKLSLANLPERLGNVLGQKRGESGGAGLPARLMDTSEGRQRLLGDRMGQSLGWQDVQTFGASLKGLFSRKKQAQPKKPKPILAQMAPIEPLPPGKPSPNFATAFPPAATPVASPVAGLGSQIAAMQTQTLPSGSPPLGQAQAPPLGQQLKTSLKREEETVFGSRGGDQQEELTQALKDLLDEIKKLNENMGKGGKGQGTAEQQGTGMARTPGQVVSTASRSFAPEKSGPTVGSSTRPRLTTTVVDSQTFTRMRG